MKKILAVIAALGLFLTLGCAAEKEQQAETLPKLTVGLMPDTDSIPFIIAEQQGYFKEEGIEVELMPFKSAMERDAALQSGNLDGAVSDLLAVIFARSGGFAVHATSYTDGSYNLIAGGQAGISSVDGMRGKEIAISRNTIIEYVTDEVLAAQKMNEYDVSKVVIPQIPVRLEMLQSGNLDAARWRALPWRRADVILRDRVISASIRALWSLQINQFREKNPPSGRCTALMIKRWSI